MNQLKKMNLVASHMGEQHFDKDLELYKKTFPDKSIIKELEKAESYQKKALDERILLELLDAVDIKDVIANRGGDVKKTTTKKAETKKPTPPSNTVENDSQRPKANKETSSSEASAKDDKKKEGHAKNTQESTGTK